MKKLLFPLFVSIILFSCEKKPEKILRENIEKNLIEKLDDPKSYEFVSITIKEPYTKSDSLLDYTDWILNDFLPIKEGTLDVVSEIISDMHFYEDFEDLEEYQNQYNSLKQEIEDLFKEMDNLIEMANEPENKVQVLKNVATFKMRANNKMGAKILDSFDFYYNDDYEIIKILK